MSKKRHVSVFLVFIILLMGISGCNKSSGSIPRDDLPEVSGEADPEVLSGDTVKNISTEEDFVNEISMEKKPIEANDMEENFIEEDSMEEDSMEEIQEAVAQGKESDVAYIVLNNNIPLFSDDEVTTEAFEQYSELDELGRCGTAFACIGKELMPTEERGAIGQVRPSGWHTVKYDGIDGLYLYNRCHLIGYQLAGENANEKNLITGTRFLNVNGMLPFENLVADYVEGTGNHVMYRVTPLFEGDNLLAEGVEMEAYSVEDSGAGVSFHVFVYNKQPGIAIDYATGDSRQEESGIEGGPEGKQEEKQEGKPEEKQESLKTETIIWADEANGDYVVNINTMRFHFPDCGSVNQMKEKNKRYYNGSREPLMEAGYVPCGNCNP